MEESDKGKTAQRRILSWDNISKALSVVAILIAALSLYESQRVSSLVSGSNAKDFWGEIRSANTKVHAENEILKKQLAAYVTLLEMLQTQIHAETGDLLKHKKDFNCSDFKALPNRITLLGAQVDGVVSKLRREYFYTALSEDANAKSLSILGWKQFLNESDIDPWRFDIILQIMHLNLQYADLQWGCATTTTISTNELKDVGRGLSSIINDLNKAYSSLFLLPGNPVVNAFETLLKENDINKVGSTY